MATHRNEFRKAMEARPRYVDDGQISFALPKKLAKRQDELALTVHFISDRKLFGLAYWEIQPSCAVVELSNE